MATVAPTRRSGPWRVAIDAGHGGHDPGTVSPRTGAREKDISLKLALLVAEELKSRGGIEPFLTREDDRFIRLEDRPKLAIAANADLFVSIHVNAQPRGSSASGFETYYLGQARSEMSRQVAMRENAVIELEGAGNRPNLDQLEFILAGLDRDVNLVESRRFAGYIQNGLRTALDSKDRGVKSNIFYVLLTTGSMPAVLVETGYITNPTDERRLTDENTQRKIARALADTIETYFKDTGRRLQAVESD
jgi:N-acetylmuramoyl-L-alanine amidase